MAPPPRSPPHLASPPLYLMATSHASPPPPRRARARTPTPHTPPHLGVLDDVVDGGGARGGASCSGRVRRRGGPRGVVACGEEGGGGGGEGGEGAGGDRVRGLDGGHGEQQRGRDDAEEQFPSVREGPGRGHGAVLQRAAAAGLHLGGARPAAARAGLPRPGLRHRRLRPRRLLRLRRHRPRQRHRRRPGSDPAVEGGGVLQGVPASSPAARRARGGAADRPRSALRRQHRHQRLPGELLPLRHGEVPAVHRRRVRGLPRRAGGGVPHRHLPPRRAARRLRRAQRHRLPAAGADAQRPPRRLHRGVQSGGQGLQRQVERHDRRAPELAPRPQDRLHPGLRGHAQAHQQSFHTRAGERRAGLLRDGDVRDELSLQREEPPDMPRCRQILLLGLLPSDREGEPVLRQFNSADLLKGAPLMNAQYHTSNLDVPNIQTFRSNVLWSLCR